MCNTYHFQIVNMLPDAECEASVVLSDKLRCKMLHQVTTLGLCCKNPTILFVPISCSIWGWGDLFCCHHYHHQCGVLPALRHSHQCPQCTGMIWLPDHCAWSHLRCPQVSGKLEGGTQVGKGSFPARIAHTCPVAF